MHVTKLKQSEWGKREPKGIQKWEKGESLGMNAIKHVTYLHKNLFMKPVAKYMDICQLICIK